MCRAPRGLGNFGIRRGWSVCSLISAVLLMAACGDDKPSLGDVSSTTIAPSTTTPAPTTAGVTTTVYAGPTTTLGPLPPELASPKLNDKSTVTTAGIGTLMFGMTVPQAQTAIGARLLTETGGPPNGQCYYVKAEQGPDGVFFVVSSSTIERVDIRSGAVKTRSGLGIGSTIDQLKTALGAQLQVTGNTAEYVPTSANDANYRVIFDTDGTKVVSFRAGKLPIVTPPRAC